MPSGLGVLGRVARFAVAAALCATPAFASVRAGGAPRCNHNGDWPPTLSVDALQSAIAAEPGNTLRRVLTVDFDRDGDLDVLATTDWGVRVWLNDGQGNLVVQPPQPAPAIVAFATVLREPLRHDDTSESIQNDLPSFRVHQSRSHAPPDGARGFALVSWTAALRNRTSISLIPRAPPLTASAPVSE